MRPCSSESKLLLVTLLALLVLLAPSSLFAQTPDCSRIQKRTSPLQTHLKFAQGFSVSTHSGYKILQIFKIDGSLAQEYVLVNCPSLLPASYQKTHPKTSIISLPIRSLISLSTTHLEFLNQLGQLHSLVGISQKQFISNQTIRQKIQDGKIVEVGPDYNLNQEKIVAMRPQLLMTTGTNNPKRDGYAALMNAGISVVINVEYQEKTPLATAEWIKFMALFFNEEAKADALFEQVARSYQDLQKLTKKLKKKPTVLTGAPYKGVWYISGGQSSLSVLLKDAGAKYLWEESKQRNAIPLDLESVLSHAANADFWIQPGTWTSIQDALNEDVRYRYFQALTPGRIFNNNAILNTGGGNDYWERGIANPHWVLSDLIKIFHPELLPKHKLIWFHPLLKQ